MRNYIILNDINSNTINGLLIQELPPISKPKMRTRTEEIDGRAGDIVTQLGFKAYDKTIKIGLYGDFDINEVISYFNSSGQVVFSNEPDKYYNYQILEQIDYERLIRFRTAKVKMHVQPFKYPTEEEPLVGQYQYVTNTGSNMSLNNTANALFKKFDLKGNTSQDGTPTPSLPIPVNVVSGDNAINITDANNNLFISTPSPAGQCLLNTGEVTSGSDNLRYTTNYIEIPTGTKTIYISGISSDTLMNAPAICFYNSNKEFISGESYSNRITAIIELPTNTRYIRTSYRSVYSAFSINACQKYPIYLGVENLFDKNNVVSSSTTSKYYDFPTPLIAGTYTFSSTNTASKRVRIFTGASYDASVYTDVISWSVASDITFTTTDYINRIQINSGTQIYLDGWNIQLTKGSIASHISDTPIELCKIGTYQDYIYKDNGSWYLHKEIGKVVLDGSESSFNYTNGVYYSQNNTLLHFKLNTSIYSNFFSYGGTCNSTTSAYNNGNNKISLHTSDDYRFYLRNDNLTSKADWTSWLTTHNTIVYYPLATPTTTEITDTELINQLEALKQANSYEGQTNISHDSNDAPFLVDVSALQSGTDELTVNNEGNIYSRPTLDLEGTGIVNVYLEGNQMFQVDLTDTNEIVIDTDEMEAYNPTTQALMNRQVTGNYDNFKLNVGDNTLKFSGDLTKATVTNYVRWL